MNKLLTFFLSFFYLVMALGVTQYSHACKSTGVIYHSFIKNEVENKDKPCPICSAKEKGLSIPKKDCCKYDSKLVKVDDSVKKQSDFDFSVKFWGNAIPNKMLGSVFDFSIVEPNTTSNNLYFSRKVPIKGNPLYILHCVYRI